MRKIASGSLLRAFALAGLASIAGRAHAGTLASSFINANLGVIVCRLTNTGTTPVVITSASLFSFDGSPIPAYDSCTGTLAPGNSCIVDSVMVTGGRGVIEVQGSTRKLRAQCVVENGNEDLATSEMR